MTMTPFKRFQLLGLSTAILTCSCAGGNNRSVQQARSAEERGEAHLAYDAYCTAAKQRPDDASIAASIRRLAPTAATYWESQARIAASEGDYGEAWRRGMKSLQIRPDQPGMAEFVSQLEAKHASAIEPSKRQWMNSGKMQVTAPPTRVAAAKSAESPVPAQAAYGAPVEQSESRARTADTRDRDRAREAEVERARQREERLRQERERQIAVARQRERDRKDGSDDPADGAGKSGDGAESADFAVLFTLSRDEDRHPKRQRLADGIFMKLRDVDEDRTAGMDLDDGDDRVQKIRDLKVGQSKLFRGRSGKWFRFTLIEVQPEKKTIRVGVRPA